ncbi:MAG: endonuclease/exonuclease/phosphatase family protein [Muribaculaceae bacterium]|nr:endonuclease/exonuclease/phosphatase family protein [Muribaculaceae bacterium]
MLLGSCTHDHVKETPDTMVVASYNLRQANHVDSVAGNGWGQRVPHVADVVKLHGFEIFGTQEGFRYMLEDLKSYLPGYKYIGVGRDNGADEGEHAAIFYDTDKFDMLDHGDFWLSETPDSASFGWDAVCRRICTWGKFRHKDSGFTFVYFNLHMDHKGIVARAESAKLILQKIKEFPEPLPVMLSGDFNVDQTNESYRLLNESGVMKDAYETADYRYIKSSTFNSYDTGKMRLSSDGEPMRIDHIFLSPEFDVKKYGVLNDTYRILNDEGKYIARTPSDHYPVMIVVEMNEDNK